MVRSEVSPLSGRINDLPAPTHFKRRLIAQEYFGRCTHPGFIVQRDDGLYQLGLDDQTAHGPFMSRQHAEAVAAKVAA